DAAAIEAAVCAGINIVASIHSSSYEEAAVSRIGDMIKNGIFSRLIFLTNNPRTGTVKEVMKID
ncbi:MAG: AAA family ATPase, partial [Eubacteriales bacterium]|nr:AAA family ATPase [Eubacteriales bacterium]